MKKYYFRISALMLVVLALIHDVEPKELFFAVQLVFAWFQVIVLMDVIKHRTKRASQ